MKFIYLTVLAVFLNFGCAGNNAAQTTKTAPNINSKTVYDFSMNDIEGKKADLSQYKNKVSLIVNTASKCGNTPQYEGLQKIYDKYKDQGFVILGFPANNFMGQEPGTDKEIKDFCTLKYNVTFPMFSKISVKGDDQDAFYSYLTNEKAQFPGDITWNFEKFLVDEKGEVIARFSPKTKPEDPQIITAIEKALNIKTAEKSTAIEN
ncbi:MAG: glutathione peroxidase [Pyrinomonadaceae bacterium]